MTDTYTSKKITAANGAGKSCRLLGLPGDAQTNFTFPHANHACYAVDPACPVRSEHQVSHCLSAAHHDCRLYRSYQGLEGGDQNLSEPELKAILNLESPRRARLWSILGFAAVLVLVAVALLFSGDILASLASGNPAQGSPRRWRYSRAMRVRSVRGSPISRRRTPTASRAPRNSK